MITASMDGRVYNIEKRTSKNGKPYVTASLRDAVKDQEGNWSGRFINIVAFGGNGDYLANQPEGTVLIVDGTFELDMGKDKDGNPRPVGRIIANLVRKPTEAKGETTKSNEENTVSAAPAPAVKENPFS